MVYNDLAVPEYTRTQNIVSAFDNFIDVDKVEDYFLLMVEGIEFPPIMGYPSVVDEDDLGKFFMSGKKIGPEDIGRRIWMVTDGHHRTLAALKAGVEWLDVELDPSTITRSEDLELYYKTCA